MTFKSKTELNTPDALGRITLINAGEPVDNTTDNRGSNAMALSTDFLSSLLRAHPSAEFAVGSAVSITWTYSTRQIVLTSELVINLLWPDLNGALGGTTITIPAGTYTMGSGKNIVTCAVVPGADVTLSSFTLSSCPEVISSSTDSDHQAALRLLANPDSGSYVSAEASLTHIMLFRVSGTALSVLGGKANIRDGKSFKWLDRDTQYVQASDTTITIQASGALTAIGGANSILSLGANSGLLLGSASQQSFGAGSSLRVIPEFHLGYHNGAAYARYLHWPSAGGLTINSIDSDVGLNAPSDTAYITGSVANVTGTTSLTATSPLLNLQTSDEINLGATATGVEIDVSSLYAGSTTDSVSLRGYTVSLLGADLLNLTGNDVRVSAAGDGAGTYDVVANGGGDSWDTDIGWFVNGDRDSIDTSGYLNLHHDYASFKATLSGWASDGIELLSDTDFELAARTAPATGNGIFARIGDGGGEYLAWHLSFVDPIGAGSGNLQTSLRVENSGQSVFNIGSNVSGTQLAASGYDLWDKDADNIIEGYTDLVLRGGVAGTTSKIAPFGASVLHDVVPSGTISDPGKREMALSFFGRQDTTVRRQMAQVLVKNGPALTDTFGTGSLEVKLRKFGDGFGVGHTALSLNNTGLSLATQNGAGIQVTGESTLLASVWTGAALVDMLSMSSGLASFLTNDVKAQRVRAWNTPVGWGNFTWEAGVTTARLKGLSVDLAPADGGDATFRLNVDPSWAIGAAFASSSDYAIFATVSSPTSSLAIWVAPGLKTATKWTFSVYDSGGIIVDPEFLEISVIVLDARASSVA